MRRAFNRMVMILLLISSLMLACSFTVPISSSGVQFRFDGLPSKANQSPAIANYQAISAWDKKEITYAFAGGTDQLPGDTEFNVIDRAFALWDAQIPLTITRGTDPASADIVISWEVGDHGDDPQALM